ncbi:hypothetical protein HK101_011124 [Irineochytrium annulatum]|nr:hypothetical protein HK101_011124 [Irineochytrium annulatum]
MQIGVSVTLLLFLVALVRAADPVNSQKPAWRITPADLDRDLPHQNSDLLILQEDVEAEASMALSTDAIFKWPSGKKLILYHTNWACYGRNYQIKDIPINFVSDINYAFFDLRPNASGHLVPTSPDPWADTDKRYVQPGEGIDPPDSWNEDGKGLGYFGNFGQLMKLKKFAGFNLGLSIGGWTFSKRFSTAVRTPESRAAFVDAIIQIFDKYPGLFNRVDLDWEHISPPGQNHGDGGNEVHPDDAKNFVALLTLLRGRLDATNRTHFEISACVVADPAKMDALPLMDMSRLLTTINVMTYDFASSAWGPAPAGHQTNLKSTPYAPLSVERAVDELIKRGVPANKIVIGAVYYSRAFANTDGLGKSSSGVSPDKSWEDGICDYKTLPRDGATEHWDDAAKASYSYDPVKRVLSSYDTVRSIQEKTRFVWDKGLAGIIVWESSGDHAVDHERSLTKALFDGLSRDPR